MNLRSDGSTASQYDGGNPNGNPKTESRRPKETRMMSEEFLKQIDRGLPDGLPSLR
jgi:hypothetical protein